MSQAINSFFGSIMRWAYNLFASMGSEPEKFSYFAMALLFMSLLNKAISIPLMSKQMKSTKKMQDLQPQLAELEKKYGYDERVYQQKQMEFYRDNGMTANGAMSCLSFILQIVLLFAIFAVVRNPELYMFESAQQFSAINKSFLWIQDLSQPDALRYVGIPLVSALLQFLSSQLQAKTSPQQPNMRVFTIVMAIMIYFMSIQWPAAVVVYWSFNYLIDIIWRLISMAVLKARGNKQAAGEA